MCFVEQAQAEFIPIDPFDFTAPEFAIIAVPPFFSGNL
jgi:hypothetical protein